MSAILQIRDVNKVYGDGFKALDAINLEIKQGEIFALLGPNGAGKTTLISCICGIMNPTSGSILIDGYDNVREYKNARSLVGLVPQELTTDAFEKVVNTVTFSRGLFGLPKDPVYIDKILRNLSLADKRNNKLMTLSGGMKRRVMIAKALSHEPRILFLDEPTAGVDVQLRESMWKQIRELRNDGVTVILTTHYIEEAEKMADRIGIINKGSIMVVEEKTNLMKKLGKKELIFELKSSLGSIPESLRKYNLVSKENRLIFTYDANKEDSVMTNLLQDLQNEGIYFRDLHTEQSSLEDIFVGIVGGY